jgi:hypothetical protein
MSEMRQEIDERTGGVTARAVAIAFVLLVALSVAAFYVSLLWRRDYSFTSSVPAVAQFNVLVLLAAAMALPVFAHRALTRRELLTIYSILLVSAPIVSLGILYWMLPKSVVIYYLARANPAWEETLLPHVPTWFAPSDPAAVEGFFIGRAPVPWSLWATPMAAWLSFAVALFVATSCLISLLQRQWIRHERLSYPMAQIPLETIAPDGSSAGGRGRLTANKALWIGAGISFALTFLSGLSSRIPSVPEVPLTPMIIARQKVGPLAGLGSYEPWLFPWLIALAYLIPKELSFSCWFFWLVRLGLTVAAIAAGHEPEDPEEWFGDPSFPAPYFQGTGALLALGIWGLWMARKHLSRVLRVVLSRDRGSDSDEPIPYRLAVLGFVVSSCYLIAFYCMAGCRWPFALLLVLLLLSYYVIWARLRAETGLGFLAFPQGLGTSLRGLLGTASLRPRELVTLAASRWVFSPGEGLSFDTTTGNLSDAFKVADAADLNRRRLMAAALCALVFALLVGAYIGLKGTYHYGFLNTAVGGAYGYPWLQTKFDPAAAVEGLMNPRPANVSGMIATGAGAVVAVGLGLLRLRFWWWPFHPIGYLAAMCWGWTYRATPFFIGWIVKSLVIRYGGLRLYRATIPLAVGMIVGDVLNSGVWQVVALLTKGKV